MRFCIECIKDSEIRAAIEADNSKGDCPICGRNNVWIYDSEFDVDNTYVEELLASVLEIYKPESELPLMYPDDKKKKIGQVLLDDWSIFSCNSEQIEEIVRGLVENAIELDISLDKRILSELVGIPQVCDEVFLTSDCIMGNFVWSEFKKYLRNQNRFHEKFINKKILEDTLRETEITIAAGERFYRARVSNEKGSKGFLRKEMWAPPDDVATPGRANSKGQSCLYLSNRRKTTVKEIRAHAFDYVTIATFKLKKEIKLLDLSAITHNSPFYAETDKVTYLFNERILKAIEEDLSKPMSRWDSELDYLPTQYVSDFAKYLDYDGIKYCSTFDRESFNIALFDSELCDCIYHRNYLVGDLDYRMTAQ